MQVSSSESTSRSLLQRAKQRDAQAWVKLTGVYSPLIYHWCRKAGLQADDAADVAQEVFRSVAGALSDFRNERPEDSFRGWLATITRNKICDHFRAQAARPQAAGGSSTEQRIQQLEAAAPWNESGEDDLEIRSRLARRAVALMQSDFSESSWQAFWQTAVEQRSAAEVAAALKMSPAAVYIAKSRVLRRLREELAGLDLLDDEHPGSPG